MRPGLACALLACAGCHTVFDLAPIPTLDGSPGVDLCIDEDFAQALDPTRWGLFGTPQGVKVHVDTGQLHIDVPQMTSSSNVYGGIRSGTVDLTGGSLSMILVQPAPATQPSAVLLQLEFDSLNHYALLVQRNKLVARSYVSGTATDHPIAAYDPDLHREMRLRHDAGSHDIVFEAGGSPADVTEVYREPIAFDPGVVDCIVRAGSFDPAAAFTGVVDGVVVFGHCSR